MTNRPPDPDTTPEDLRALLIEMHRLAGWSSRDIAVLIMTHEHHGLLRDNCPPWKQRSALFILTKAKAPTTEELDRYADRITDAILARVD